MTKEPRKIKELSGVGDHYEFSEEEPARQCAKDIGGELCIFERSNGTLWIVRLEEE